MMSRAGDARKTERGIALVIAILSLMLLTFLGLALATTTSTELQIATNYRWSQQALYNAEAGLELGRPILSHLADPTLYMVLPQIRPGSWEPEKAPAPLEAGTGRDFEKRDCDTRNNMGYGLVIDGKGTRYEGFSSYGGRSLNGAVTLWVRRQLITNADGLVQDDNTDRLLVLVSEGVAPYRTSSAFTRARQAVRILEVPLGIGVEPICEVGGQEGVGGTGENYNPCTPLSREHTKESLGLVFGGTGAGDLTSTEAK